ncbi:MAG: hypothetical protein ACYDDA_15090 [Acidiferrobacteraceae bacterium]
MAKTVRWIVRSTALGALLLTSTVAHALRLELGAGERQYQPAPPGIWYQPGFPYALTLTGPVVSIGIVGQLRPWLRYGVRYIDLGDSASLSSDTPSDRNYNGATGCNGVCWPLAQYSGHGSVQGIAVTAQPQIQIAPHLYEFVEIGPWIYRATWHMSVSQWRPARTSAPQNLQITHAAHWQVGYVFGTGVRYRKTALAIDIYDTRAMGDQWPSVTPLAYTIVLRREF